MRQQALRWIFLLPIIFGLGFGCQPAGRYPPQESKKSPVEEKTPLPAELAWLEPAPKHAIPILFVPETDKDNWARLPAFWNHFPPAPSGMATGHLGLSPLGAVVTILWTRQIEKIIIKVPRGLPDPTPFLPKSNQPTLGQWKLGKKLFFDKTLPISKIEDLACASCHDPKTGFTEAWAINRLGKMNTPSLINCVYNKHQFWDGRATFLEQVIVKELNDENLPMEQRPVRHSWGGLVKALREKPEYQLRFREVFGVRQPTQDTIAKALAAYLRTILSGNSLYDRAEVERLKLGETELAAKHFEPVLDDAALKNLESTKKEVAAAALVQGYKLFN